MTSTIWGPTPTEAIKHCWRRGCKSQPLISCSRSNKWSPTHAQSRNSEVTGHTQKEDKYGVGRFDKSTVPVRERWEWNMCENDWSSLNKQWKTKPSNTPVPSHCVFLQELQVCVCACVWVCPFACYLSPPLELPRRLGLCCWLHLLILPIVDTMKVVCFFNCNFKKYKKLRSV